MASAEVEIQRTASLVEAEKKAVELFEEIERDLLKPGISDKDLSDKIHALGVERHNVRTHWHKRIVRSGPNTLAPFDENTPDRVIQEDDIVIVDLGPVFQEWEADFGRTYVMGNDPEKKKIVAALEPIWNEVHDKFKENPSMTGGELFEIANDAATREGWKWGAFLAGHTVGDFPHERIPRDKISLYIVKENDISMSTVDKKGFKRHWILEIHLRDPAERYQAFYEQLLTF